MIGVDRYEGDYHFNTIRPLAGTNGEYCGKNKGVLISSGRSESFMITAYRANGSTFDVRIIHPGRLTQIYPFRVWGVSFDTSNGASAGLLA